MTSKSNNPTPAPSEVAELKGLIAALSDGQLMPAERDRLEQMLRANRGARSMYMAYMQLDAGLDWKIRGRQSLHGLTDLSREQEFAAAVSNGPRPKGAAGLIRTRLFYIATALAASLAVVLASAHWLSSHRESNLIGAVDSNDPNPGNTDVMDVDDSAVANIVELSEECSWFVENRRNEDGGVVVGDKIRLTRGQLRVEFTCGATVTMKSPAALEVVSPTRTRAVFGTFAAHVEKGAEGFTVETPRTTVVDLGTDFGIDVTDFGSTDVVVFTGAVDVHSDGVEGLESRQRLRAGEGVRVSGEGTASRIVSIIDSQFSIAAGAAAPRHRTPVISAVSDNIRRGESWHYYEIVHGGMREDAKAFVDRKDHEWNGVDAAGIPSYLRGADYVKTFNDDKLNREVEIQVTLDRPAILYVLLDKRSPVPDWLRDTFFNTGDEIGIDGGGYTRFDERKTVAVGPGVSIDDTFSIWRCDVPTAGTVKLGAIQIGGETHNMYGIIAVPLEIHDGRDDIPGSAAHPCSESALIVPDAEGKLTSEGAIERPADVDVFRFDWNGGVVQVACHTSGFTTLDPVLSVYDANETLVGTARSKRSGRDRVAVTMNLPPGAYHVAVTGGDEVGEVGVYQLEVSSALGEIAPPLPPSPSIAFDAAPAKNGVKLTWNSLPQAKSYTVERSRDAVKFRAVTTTTDTSVVDVALSPGETCIYRLRANADFDPLVSAPLMFRASASAVERLQGFGHSPQSILLEWRDGGGEEAYRIERSLDGGHFDTIGTVPQNASGYRDSDVEPGKRYFYRVATVNSDGDDALSEPIQALSGVADLSAAAVASDRVVLSWRADHPQARLFIERADKGDEFVTIGALDGSAHEFVDERAVPGKHLRYRVVAVEDRSELAETKTSEIDGIRLPDWVSEDHFALRFTGKVRIDKAGKYSFYLNSDDGGRLFLDGSLVVDNDGRHPPRMVCGTIQLAAGYHDLEVQYFEHDGRNTLEAWWSGPGADYGIIPDSAYSSLTCRYYQGTWWRLPFGRSSARSQTVTVTTPEASNASVR